MPFFDPALLEDFAELFEALAEYDKTGTKKKLSYKTRANFTLDNELFLQFKKYCSERGMKMSSLLETKIKEILSGAS